MRSPVPSVAQKDTISFDPMGTYSQNSTRMSSSSTFSSRFESRIAPLFCSDSLTPGTRKILLALRNDFAGSGANKLEARKCGGTYAEETYGTSSTSVIVERSGSCR